MASYNPPKKNTAYRMFVGLRSQADTRLFQVNPTLASGDAKVSKDGGALANLATLPAVIGSSAVVQIDLSSTEMNADNVTILLSDAAGGQWCDLIINLQTAARQFDELASQASVDAVDDYVDTEMAAALAAVDTEIAAIKAKTDLIPASPAAVGSAMSLAADAVNSTSLAASAVAEIQAGLSTLTAGQVNAEVVDALSVDTYAEPGSVPAATASLKDKVGWLFMLARNKRLTTASADKVRNDADSGDVATATLSDDGTTFTRGEYA